VLKKNILLLLVLFFLASIQSCSASKVKNERKMVTALESMALAEKCFIDACLLTYTSMRGSPDIASNIITNCTTMWFRYQRGAIGITLRKIPIPTESENI